MHPGLTFALRPDGPVSLSAPVRSTSALKAVVPRSVRFVRSTRHHSVIAYATSSLSRLTGRPELKRPRPRVPNSPTTTTSIGGRVSSQTHKGNSHSQPSLRRSESQLSTMFSSASPSIACYAAHHSSFAGSIPPSGVPVVQRSASSEPPSTFGSPQCCHCGHRGAHANNCPFNSAAQG
jgi:hypothetical protein